MHIEVPDIPPTAAHRTGLLGFTANDEFVFDYKLKAEDERDVSQRRPHRDQRVKDLMLGLISDADRGK